MCLRKKLMVVSFVFIILMVSACSIKNDGNNSNNEINSEFGKEQQLIDKEEEENIVPVVSEDDKELEEKLEGSSIKLYNLGDTLRLDEKIDKINYSMERGRTLDIEYFTINKNTLYEENVDPYNLIFKDGDWYIVGYSHDEDKVKVYRLSRIRNIDITNDIYMKPKTFSLNDFLTNSWGVFNGEKQLVKVKFSKNVAELIRKVKWSSTQEIEDLDDGSMILKFYIDELGDIKTWILGFGGEAEVIEPLSLRADINEEIKKLLNIYK